MCPAANMPQTGNFDFKCSHDLEMRADTMQDRKVDILVSGCAQASADMTQARSMYVGITIDDQAAADCTVCHSHVFISSPDERRSQSGSMMNLHNPTRGRQMRFFDDFEVWYAFCVKIYFRSFTPLSVLVIEWYQFVVNVTGGCIFFDALDEFLPIQIHGSVSLGIFITWDPSAAPRFAR
jgi:hypothetical protein